MDENPYESPQAESSEHPIAPQSAVFALFVLRAAVAVMWLIAAALFAAVLISIAENRLRTDVPLSIWLGAVGILGGAAVAMSWLARRVGRRAP